MHFKQQKQDSTKKADSRCLQTITVIMLVALMAFMPACSKETDSTSETPEPVSSPVASPSLQANVVSKEPDGPEEPDYLKEARAINDDVVGWIKIDNTNIDYPVLKTTDNEFYIDHDIEKKESKSGAIFMDLRNVYPDQQRHLIFYGHNMKNGTMFHDLSSYKLKDFFENNKKISVWIFGEEREYEVIGEYLLSVDLNFIQTEFATDEEFVEFLTLLQGFNKFKTGYKPDAKDEILTLSTCTYEYEDTRNVVQAKRVK